MSLTLYHSPISTCSQKVRLALAEKGLDYDSRIIELRRQEHLENWYLAINPNGVVPALVHNGRPVIDSSVICEYLDEAFPEPALGPRDPLGRAAMRAWMRYFEEVPTTAIRIPSFNKLFAAELAEMEAAKFEEMRSKMPLRKQFYRQMGRNGFSEQQYNDSIDRLSQCLARVEQQLSDDRPTFWAITSASPISYSYLRPFAWWISTSMNSGVTCPGSRPGSIVCRRDRRFRLLIFPDRVFGNAIPIEPSVLYGLNSDTRAPQIVHSVYQCAGDGHPLLLADAQPGNLPRQKSLPQFQH